MSHAEAVHTLQPAAGATDQIVRFTGSLRYDDLWGRVPIDASDTERMAAYATERGWAGGEAGSTGHLREKLVSGHSASSG